MRTLKNYKNINLPSFNEEQLKEIAELQAMDDKDINVIDIPELTSEQMKAGHFAYANSLKMKKVSVHIQLDEDNLDWLKGPGKGYQPRLNKVLRWAKLNNCPIDHL